MRILVVGNDQPITSFVKRGLEADQYAVEIACDGEQARSLVEQTDFDLVIVDSVLPKLDGFELLNRLRIHKPSLPVMILSGRARLEEPVNGLDLAARDYLAKPFSFSELSARVHALLRRSPDRVEIVLRVEDLELDRAERVVRRAGRRINLTPREFALLEYLMRNAGRCVTRAMIIEHVWEFPLDAITNVVDVYINYLRKKIGEGFEKPLIHTVRGLGYQLGGEEKPNATA